MSLFHSSAICEDELLVPPPMPQRTRLRPKIFGRSAHAQILYLLAQNIISTITKYCSFLAPNALSAPLALNILCAKLIVLVTHYKRFHLPIQKYSTHLSEKHCLPFSRKFVPILNSWHDLKLCCRQKFRKVETYFPCL